MESFLQWASELLNVIKSRSDITRVVFLERLIKMLDGNGCVFVCWSEGPKRSRSLQSLVTRFEGCVREK